MEELLFFAVIVFFSIIESIARSRKAKRAGESGESEDVLLPDLPLPEERDWRDEHVGPMRDTVPTYDDDASYDEVATARSSGRATHPEQNRGAGASESVGPASETMLPGGLFQELAELAGQLERSKAEARTLRLPKESPRLPLPTAETSVFGDGEHVVHRAHVGYGTDPSERIRSEQDGLDPLETRISEDVRAIRGQLASRSVSELRRAVILHEVFEPPVALRENGR